MLLPLSLFIFFAAYYEESYQRLCENPRTLCLTGNLYVLYLLFSEELRQSEKEHSSLEKVRYFSPITLHKCAPQSLIIIFIFPEILKKTPRLSLTVSCLLPSGQVSHY